MKYTVILRQPSKYTAGITETRRYELGLSEANLLAEGAGMMMHLFGCPDVLIAVVPDGYDIVKEDVAE